MKIPKRLARLLVLFCTRAIWPAARIILTWDKTVATSVCPEAVLCRKRVYIVLSTLLVDITIEFRCNSVCAANETLIVLG